ncbi:MAG TPA: hypothetical protein VGB55_09855, partial [Tepidisphaeraceae bacterium]
MDDPRVEFHVRSFRPEDSEACQKLFHDGVIGGAIAENDTGLDIDDIEGAYLRTEGNHFWVAALPDGD